MQERGTKHAPASLWGRAVLFPGLCFPNFRLPRVGWGMSQHGEVLWGCWRSFLGVCGAFFPVCGGRLEASALPSSVCVGFQGSGCGAGFCWQSRVLKSAKLNSGSSGELEKCPEELGCLGFSFPARILCFRGVFFFFALGSAGRVCLSVTSTNTSGVANYFHFWALQMTLRKKRWALEECSH